MRRLPATTGLLGAVALAWALTACTTASPSASSPTPVTIAAASDLTFAFDELTALVAEQHPELELRVTYGSSGQFAQQIRNGAPFDLYLSADREYVDGLVDDGLAEADQTFDYAVGRLVVWYPAEDGGASGPATADAGAAAGLAGLADPEIDVVAIANPEHAPYGRAAMAALEAAGLGDVVAPKLVLGENVAQAAEFARTGNADAAIIALSLALADPLTSTGRWSEVPSELVPPLRQAGTVLTRSEHPEAAGDVVEVLTSAAGRDILQRYGFALPEEAP